MTLFFTALELINSTRVLLFRPVFAVDFLRFPVCAMERNFENNIITLFPETHKINDGRRYEDEGRLLAGASEPPCPQAE